MATASSSRNPIFSNPVLPSSSSDPPTPAAPSSAPTPPHTSAELPRYVTRQDCPFVVQSVGLFIRSQSDDWCPTDNEVASLIQMQDAQVITMTPHSDRRVLVGIAVGIPSCGTRNRTNDTYSIPFIILHKDHVKRGLYKRLVAELMSLCRGKKFVSEITTLSSLAGFNTLLELKFDMAQDWNLKFATIQRSAISSSEACDVEEIKNYNPVYDEMLKLENRAFRTYSYRGEEEEFEVPKNSVCYAIPNKDACLWVQDTHAANTSIIGPIIAKNKDDVVSLLQGTIQLAGRHPTHQFQVLALDKQWGTFEKVGFQKVRIVPYMQHLSAQGKNTTPAPHDSIYGLHGWSGIPKGYIGEDVDAGEPPRYILKRNDIMMATPRLISRFIRKETPWIPSDEEVTSLIRMEDSHVFTMSANRKLVATAMIVPTAPGFQPVFLTNVIVAKAHRGKGIGRRMLAEIIIFCESKQISEIRLMSSPAAFNLYLSMKFEMIDEWNMYAAQYKKVAITAAPTTTTPTTGKKLPYDVRQVDPNDEDDQLVVAQALSLESKAYPGSEYVPPPSSKCYVLGGSGGKALDACLWMHTLFDSNAAFIGPVVAKTPAAATQLITGAIRLSTATDFRTLCFVHHEGLFDKMGFKSVRIVPYMRRTLSGGRNAPKPPGKMAYSMHNWHGP